MMPATSSTTFQIILYCAQVEGSDWLHSSLLITTDGTLLLDYSTDL